MKLSQSNQQRLAALDKIDRELLIELARARCRNESVIADSAVAYGNLVTWQCVSLEAASSGRYAVSITLQGYQIAESLVGRLIPRRRP